MKDNNIFDVVLLFALPASGKSEVRHLLSNVEPDRLVREFHIGENVQLDDFPYVYMMRCVDEELAKLGEKPLFADKPGSVFKDDRFFGALIRMLNEDYEDLFTRKQIETDNVAKYFLDRFDQAYTMLSFCMFSIACLLYLPFVELYTNNVTDITPIGLLKHLQFAELFSNPFTDISALSNCTELLDLNITNCQVLDFSPLDNVQTLERMWANMIRHLSEEETERFKKIHPNCLCDFQPSHAATVDGWRKHIRNKHYIWCFKNKQWIPFNEEIPGVKLKAD